MGKYLYAIRKPSKNLKAWLIGIIFALPIINLIGNFFIAGYAIQIIKKTFEKDGSMPDWGKAGSRLFIDGIIVWFINLVYKMPGYVLLLLSFILIAWSSALTAVNLWNLNEIYDATINFLYSIPAILDQTTKSISEGGINFVISSFNELITAFINSISAIPEFYNSVLNAINTTGAGNLLLWGSILFIISHTLILIGMILGLSAILNFAKTNSWKEAFNLGTVVRNILRVRFISVLIVASLYVFFILLIVTLNPLLSIILIPIVTFPLTITVYTIMAEAY